jgi:hypothetical protein
VYSNHDAQIVFTIAPVATVIYLVACQRAHVRRMQRRNQRLAHRRESEERRDAALRAQAHRAQAYRSTQR